MKQKDLVLIVGVVIVSAIVSLFLSRALFASPKDRQQQVEVVQAISPTFPTADPTYFNPQSVDPTQLIQINNNNNPNPINGSGQ